MYQVQEGNGKKYLEAIKRRWDRERRALNSSAYIVSSVNYQ
jgi:hypothetical protein